MEQNTNKESSNKKSPLREFLSEGFQLKNLFIAICVAAALLVCFVVPLMFLLNFIIMR